MKKILLVSSFLFVFSCGVNKQFVKTVDSFTTAILPEYQEYVKKDSTISEDTKRIRIRSAEKFQSLVSDAKGK